MALDPGLLEKARQAGTRLAEAERAALGVRSEYHAAIRRLHLDGGSLREIAVELGLSHQRVQQIVDGAGGTWWQRLWKARRKREAGPCSFCGRPPAAVAKLIAGPAVFICDGCVRAAESAAAPFNRTGQTRQRCSFCGKSGRGDRQMLTSAGGNICSDCLTVCRAILTDRSS
ncbi:MAG TPA: ClpX C4-type zinc finger protein [Vicinamibacterales bacterium]|nr:ClpX C4-type zinc finger protein [Vicinamibacterales bacterium]